MEEDELVAGNEGIRAAAPSSAQEQKHAKSQALQRQSVHLSL